MDWTFTTWIFTLLLLPAGSLLITKSGCNDNTIILKCKHGHRIKIDQVLYGRGQQGRCTYLPEDCASEDSGLHPCTGDIECQTRVPHVQIPGCGPSTYQKIVYRCVPDNEIVNICAVENITKTEGYLRSPSYPNPFPIQMSTCSIKIEVPAKHRIHLYILDLDLASSKNIDGRAQCRDQLAIYEQLAGEGSVKFICNAEHVLRGQEIYTSGGHILMLEFGAGYSTGTHRGFWVYYKAVPIEGRVKPGFQTTLMPPASFTSDNTIPGGKPVTDMRTHGEQGSQAWGPILGGVLGAMALLAFVLVLLICVFLRNRSKSPALEKPRIAPDPYDDVVIANPQDDTSSFEYENVHVNHAIRNGSAAKTKHTNGSLPSKNGHVFSLENASIHSGSTLGITTLEPPDTISREARQIMAAILREGTGAHGADSKSGSVNSFDVGTGSSWGSDHPSVQSAGTLHRTHLGTEVNSDHTCNLTPGPDEDIYENAGMTDIPRQDCIHSTPTVVASARSKPVPRYRYDDVEFPIHQPIHHHVSPPEEAVYDDPYDIGFNKGGCGSQSDEDSTYYEYSDISSCGPPPNYPAPCVPTPPAPAPKPRPQTKPALPLKPQIKPKPKLPPKPKPVETSKVSEVPAGVEMVDNELYDKDTKMLMVARKHLPVS